MQCKGACACPRCSKPWATSVDSVGRGPPQATGAPPSASCVCTAVQCSEHCDAAHNGQHPGRVSCKHLLHVPSNPQDNCICCSPGRQLPAKPFHLCWAVQAPTAEGFTDPAGLCSTYLDTFGSDAGSTFARFLAVVNFLTANGLYVVIDYQYQQASSTIALVLGSRCSVVA